MRRYFTLLSFLLFILILVGCRNNIIRYQMVSIPGYGKTNYEALLNSRNEEIKYNAICNLIEYASEYARTLNKGLPEETANNMSSQETNYYEVAERVYQSIASELHSTNENIKAASLIFLTEFASKYENHQELLDAVMAVEARGKRTQYEQLYALITVSDSKTIINEELIDEYLDSKSWLIKSMVYLLLGKTQSRNYHERLVKAYKNTSLEYNKLLIINAFGKSYGTNVLTLIKDELADANSGIGGIVRRELINSLKYCDNTELVSDWIINNYDDFEKKDLQEIINNYSFEIDNNKGTIFFKALLDSENDQLINLIGESGLYGNLYNALIGKEKNTDLPSFEQALLDNTSLKQSWNEFKTKRTREEFVERETERIAEITFKKYVPRLIDISESFLQDMKISLVDTGFNEEEIEKVAEEYREGISELIKGIEEKEEEQ